MAVQTKQQYPATDWRSIARMRDQMIHRYFGVDYDIRVYKDLWAAKI